MTSAEAFAAQRPPLYGHLVIARSALEASTISWWLAERGIGAEARSKRGLSEFLYSATEEAWLQIEPDAATRVDEWVARATLLEWPATDQNGKPWSVQRRGKPLVDGIGRPSIPWALARLLVNDDTARLGNFQWSRRSAVSHVTWFGLRWAFARRCNWQRHDRAKQGAHRYRFCGSDHPGAVRRPGASQAATARFSLMGWSDRDWETAARDAGQLKEALLQAARLDHTGDA